MVDVENIIFMEISKGSVIIEFCFDFVFGYCDWICELVCEGFYDGIVFYCVIDGFMV